MHKNDPIAVFDSGLGGISVLRRLIRIMPKENYIYFGDRSNAPYGIKTAEEVCLLTEQALELLIEKQAKAIVLACNTATAAAAAHLRARYPQLPIIGMEPALKPAALQLPGKRILVMATAMTLREQKFAALLEQYAHMAEFIPLPAPGIVECVEHGMTEGAALDAYLSELLAPYAEEKIDGIVLGCTHYPLADKAILSALGYDVPLFDGAEGTAKETLHRLESENMLCDKKENGTLEFCGSGNDCCLEKLCRKLLNI